jgi:hypothetical protein
MHRFLFLVPVLLLMVACQPPDPGERSADAQPVSFSEQQAADLDPYWYQGKAEINRYVLEQNRYQDVHPGEAVLIFVTEDFRSDIHVKSEGGNKGSAVSSLKMNAIRRFPTGLYDYSIMTSVFTPVEGEEKRTMKVSMSSQDWCGQSFMQLNLEKDQYEVQLRSYFESEGDQNFEVAAVILEDELLNRIRIQPDALPEGNFSILPSAFISRLMHLPYEAVPAIGKAEGYSGSEFEGENLRLYQVEMPSLRRNLKIVFENQSPYRIVGWLDSYPSAFDGKIRSTKAVLDHSIQTAYWQENRLTDQEKRAALGLSEMR